MNDLIKREDAINVIWEYDVNPSADGMIFEAQSHIDRDIRLIPSADRGKERVNMDMEIRAMDIVANYIWKHLDKSDKIKEFSVFTVWKCKTLQNWKFLISSTLLDGMYYEVTFNGDKNEWYLDAYKKFENQVIPEQTERNE